jgi:hypothetical protein
MEGDFASVIVIEKAESLHHFFAGVSLGHLLGHHLGELVVLNDTGAILIDVGDHLLDFLTLGLESKGAHGNLEFFLVDIAGTISVEEVKGLLDFLLLFFGKLGSLFGSR